MSIFQRIISKLRDMVHAIGEKIEERRAASLQEKLAELAKGTAYTDWPNSVEDLAYLVGEDGSYNGRRELWSDLGMEGVYKGTEKQNMALHARLLLELPTHGIPWPKVPA